MRRKTLPRWGVTAILASLTLIVFVLSAPAALGDAYDRGGIYLFSRVLFRSGLRGALVRGAFRTVINLLLMGILMDAIFQRIILGVSHPGAALVVGPVLIMLPYGLARALSNRWAPSTS